MIEGDLLPMPHRPTPSRHEGELRRLMNLTAAGIVGAGVLLVGVICYAGWTSNSSATARERQLLQNALDLGIARTLNEQKSVAWWDDAYTKVTAPEIDYEFLDSEFGIFLTETYGHDSVFVLNAQDQPVFVYTAASRRDPAAYTRYQTLLAPVIAEARGSTASKLRPRADLFGQRQANYRTIGAPAQSAHWSGHIVIVENRPAMVTALTILPNVDMTLKADGPPPLLVSIVLLDDEHIEDIGRSLLLKDLKLGTQAPASDRLASFVFEGDDGRNGGTLTWVTEKPGAVLLSFILPLVCLAGFAVAAQAAIMLRRLRRTSANLANREQQSRYAARHDALSGLPNRAHFADNLRTVLGQIEREGSGMHAILAYIDVDRFKDVNDTLGHPAGDALIMEVARRLKTYGRAGDFLARYGGDEFAILWTASDPSAASTLAERISKAFIAPFEIEGQSLIVTASVGIAMAPDNGTTVDEVMRHSDIALYQAKNAGRNCAVIFSEDMAEEVEERRAIEIDLQAALGTDQLQLAYQPLISCLSGGIIGAEALLRWRHPTRGMVSPGVFIPIAEQCGLMPVLGAWVLRQAMTDWHHWRELEVAVNLSPLQFRQTDLVALLQSLTVETGASPEKFVLEITEGVLMDAGERTRHSLDAIRDQGFKTALDDFGTGYSSLAYLCNFHFDKLKIDRSFVSNLSRSEGVQTIVQAVVALGKGLGMDIVAEGVETESEALTMTKFGCTELQGYYFAKPMAAAELKALLKTYVPKYLTAPAGRVEAAE
jgi:diguanylate cyclase (GGDEF)-like protein